MAVRQEFDVPPEAFRVAVEQLRAAALRPELHCEEMPAPQRIAPHSCALSADVLVGEEEVGGGRLVLLHDPAGNDTWHGRFRLVAYARAEIEPEMVTDPLLSAVGWAWLSDALANHGAAFTAPSGTVTRVASESFGGMAEEPASAHIEIRASWTPTGETITSHVEAWGELLCTAAGLPPVPVGVVPMPSHHVARHPGQRGR
ncbi:MAG TPA: DUF3000 domain-containing protein [Nocardioidaceae bacterium]|nr:DUF3000 domain-containing protein [Nocardioidaceae bacterium]